MDTLLYTVGHYMIFSHSLGLLGHHPSTPKQEHMSLLWLAGWHTILASPTRFTQLGPKYKVWQLASKTQKPSLTNLASHFWPHSPDLRLLAPFAWIHILSHSQLSSHSWPHNPGFKLQASHTWPHKLTSCPALLALLFSWHCMASHSLATMASHSSCHFMASHSSCHFMASHSSCHFMASHSSCHFMASHSSCHCMASLSYHFMTSYSSCHFMASHFSCRFMETLSSCHFMAPHSSGRFMATHSSGRFMATHSYWHFMATHSSCNFMATHFSSSVSWQSTEEPKAKTL